MLMIDFVARRYGQLPSHLIRSGDSIDILIADIGQTYENYRAKKANGDASMTPEVPDLSQEELLDLLDKVKKQNG
jgi:hypothetical protein